MASSEWQTGHAEGVNGAHYPRSGSHSRNVHTVKPGETAASIAQLYGVEPSMLASMNGIRVGQAIYPGQRLELGAV